MLNFTKLHKNTYCEMCNFELENKLQLVNNKKHIDNHSTPVYWQTAIKNKEICKTC